MSNKRIDLTQLGGFPLTQDALDFMQQSYRNAITGIAGRMGTGVIVSGMVDNGTAVTDGWIVWNNELLPFVGGNKQTNFIIEDVTGQEKFEDDSIKTVYHTRQARFGSGAGQIAYSSLTRLNTALKVQQDLAALQAQVDALDGFVPQGLISMWSGAIANIPAGWALCDGTNGTPNLKGRFIVGYDPGDFDYNNIGGTGGEKEVQLSVSEMPAHKHTLFFSEYGTGLAQNPGYDGGNNNYQVNVTKDTSETGGNQAHENRPPYYVLAYIIKL